MSHSDDILARLEAFYGKPIEPEDWSRVHTMLYKNRPRTIQQKYRARGPTPEQLVQYKAEASAHAALYRRAAKELKTEIERSNAFGRDAIYAATPPGIEPHRTWRGVPEVVPEGFMLRRRDGIVRVFGWDGEGTMGLRVSPEDVAAIRMRLGTQEE